MRDQITYGLGKLEKKERRLLGASQKYGAAKRRLYDKLPQKLRAALELAFEKAFATVFLKGTGVIEKTFDKAELETEFDINDYSVNRKRSAKNLRRLDRPAKKSNMVNGTVAAASGFGMGLLGFGIPEIPIFVAVLLKGVYQTAKSYGFSYESEQERSYILRLICVALTGGEEQLAHNRRLDGMEYPQGCLEEDIRIAAKVLTDAMLLEKMVQGFPVVGALGGLANHWVYRKVARVGALKYKKRYLTQKV